MNRPSAASPCSPVQRSSTPLPGVAPKRRTGDPGETPQSPKGLGQPKRRGRPPSKFFKQVEQRYLNQLTAQPVPPGERPWGAVGVIVQAGVVSDVGCVVHAGSHPNPHTYVLSTEMCSGWWWIRDPETLDATLKALHPRGIREKALHKHLTKHRDFLKEVCLRPLTGKMRGPSLSLRAQGKC